jgi:hypothetical protein
MLFCRNKHHEVETSIMKKAIWIFFALVLPSAMAEAQGVSLADIARSERDRRQDMEGERQRLLKEVLKYTNGDQAFVHLAKDFSDSDDKLFGQFPPESRDQLKKAALETLSVSRLLPVYEQSFSSDMDIITLMAVSDWYKTPLGVKILRMETAENGPPDENFLKRPVSPGRSTLIDEFDRQTQNTERVVSAITSLSHALVTGMLQNSRIPQQTRDAFLSGYEQAFASAATPRIAASNRAGNLFVYRNLSDEELDDYIAFLSTPAGRKYTRATWEAMQAALKKGGTDAGTAFGQILMKQAEH